MFTPGSRACAYKTASGRHEWPNRDPIGERGGRNLYEFVRNNPVDYIDPDWRKTYDFVKDTYYRAITFANGDIVIIADDTITVQSGNMWPFAAGSNLAKIQCLLAKLGFNLPAPNNGVYLASFNNVNAWTVEYGIPEKRVTFLNANDINGLSTANAEFRIVTVWHEMKGHNQDDQEDGSAFDAKYEAPVIAAVAKLKSQKTPADICPSCLPKNGTPWAIRNAFDKAMCACEINPPPKKK